jgi:hypothetical protein
MNITDELCAALSAIPGAIAGRSQFGSRSTHAWRIGRREFAHLHSPSLLDLRLPRSIQTRLRTDPRAHFRAGRSEWLELEFHSHDDVVAVVALACEAAAAARSNGP